MSKKTVTIQLDEREANLLEALTAKYGRLSTPTAICHASMEAGLIRLAATLGLPLDTGVWTKDELRNALDAAPHAGLAMSARKHEAEQFPLPLKGKKQ